jgi:hypothetical protein
MLWNLKKLLYFIEYSADFFYIENDAEIFPVHYTCKIAEKGFKMAFMMNKLPMINSCEIILEIFFSKIHCETQVRTILVCSLDKIR